ncbi:MAG: 2-dehydropantoate 2-reductase [Thermoflexus sp.]|uniref:ketopantoate reductase family protein n=2 Tax=Thermoflexus sp. TaxID=1969742 RepID=UPI0025D170F0|nr:2-dehydropantoate 2-reductase [Thermoflexus sp.]MCS6963567.1 2-dehydropantoate 2-reductase [Thermoflexus sp.]MDW8184449.1 2-dehydropantoate 2-reductase [Anaerolineae bacterium]
MMRIALLGTGAMGTLFGVRLARVAEVWMLGTWAEALKAARQDGLRLTTAEGEETARVATAADPTEVPPCDLALILVKTYQTERAARWARQVLRPDGIALTLQNGLGPLETLQEILGPSRALQGVTTMGATLLAPGHARLSGMGSIWLGAPSLNSKPSERIADILKQAGFQVELHRDLQGVIWGKLVVNTAINPITALFDVPNGALLERSDLWRLARGVARETAAVAGAQGISLPFQDPEGFVAEVCRRTAENSSSMRQDLRRGRPTEIDALNGAVAAIGRRIGIPTPLNEALWRWIKAAEEQRTRAVRPTFPGMPPPPAIAPLLERARS